jgi:hypothetical protein
MKTYFKISILLFFTLTFISCSKTPFVEEKPLDGTSLVYVYVMPDQSINDTYRYPTYKIFVNGQSLKGDVESLEFMKINLKPQKINLKVSRAGIEFKDLTVDFKAGNTYYFRIQSLSDDFGKYEFKQVDKNIAIEELYKTYSALDDKKTEVLKSVVVSDEQDEEINDSKPLDSKSKTDKIKEAHQLKEDGVITEQEFEKLKAEIINAD